MYYVYIMYDGLNYKIGITNNLKSRKATLQTGNSKELSIAGYVTVTDRLEAATLEKALHSKFGTCRISGEWFDCSWLMIEKTIRISHTLVRYLPNSVTVYGDGTVNGYQLLANGKEFTGYFEQELWVLRPEEGACNEQ